MSITAIAAIVLAALGALIAISHVVEGLRPVPMTPETLRWAPEIPIAYADLGDMRVRFVRAGTGPSLLLLHTLRTQLDLFEKVVPDLAKRFTVYALDYPGHGYSDIPEAKYDADFFAAATERFLETLDLRDVTLCGVSIGGAIALIIAGRRNPRVVRVVAINPYDYGRGRGMARSSWLGWMITTTSQVPVFGETVMRLRTFVIMKAVLRGGVASPESIPPTLLKEMYEVGNRRGHYRAFISLLRNSASWEAATGVYGNIRVPVNLVWGDKDWANSTEREHDRALIPGAQVTNLRGGGHFLPLDRPAELQELIVHFAGH
jgi:pimeloyl-ACP methyl ester carboxylesterase